MPCRFYFPTRAANVHRPVSLRAGGTEALLGRAPFHRLLCAARTNKVPIRLSRDAGRYLCNYVYWHALRRALPHGPLVQFIHIPASPACATAASRCQEAPPTDAQAGHCCRRKSAHRARGCTKALSLTANTRSVSGRNRLLARRLMRFASGARNEIRSPPPGRGTCRNRLRRCCHACVRTRGRNERPRIRCSDPASKPRLSACGRMWRRTSHEHSSAPSTLRQHQVQYFASRREFTVPGGSPCHPIRQLRE